jgi:hypothetical protein
MIDAETMNMHNKQLFDLGWPSSKKDFGTIPA